MQPQALEKIGNMITIQELKTTASGSLDIDLTDQTINSAIGVSYADLSQQAIDDATSEIESYLDKKILISKHTEFILSDDWYYNEAREKYEHIPNNYPIVQSDTEFDGIYLVTSEKKSQVEYYAGYRKTDQQLSDLQEDLPDLTNLPDPVPSVIRSVCANIALFRIIEGYDRLTAYGSMEKNQGGVNTTISKDVMNPERQLTRLEGWQRLQ